MLNAPGRFLGRVRLLSDGRFGRDTSAVCPFFDPQTTHCRVYAYRNSVCSTFTCAYDHGRAGEVYWERLQQLVGHVELAISQWAMERLGYDPVLYTQRLNSLGDDIGACADPETGNWTEAARRVMWGEYLGREEDFLVACGAVVEAAKDRLYEIACEAKLREAVDFEEGLRDWIPVEIRKHVREITDENAVESIPSLNYKLQLATRTLWQLPFGEGRVALAEGADVEADGGEEDPAPLGPEYTHVVRVGDVRIHLRANEARALELFEQPRHIDGDLLEDPRIDALPAPRETLAIWLRRGVLVLESG